MIKITKWYLIYQRENPSSMPAYTPSGLFYRVGFHVVPLSTGVTAVPDIEFITVQRANYITDGVDISISQDPAGVRAFVGESEDLLMMTADADRFSAAFHNNYIIF